MSECTHNVSKERKEAQKAFIKGVHERKSFWAQLMGMLVHILSFMVRKKDGEYLGTFEMTWDIARLRALEDEKRLVSDD